MFENKCELLFNYLRYNITYEYKFYTSFLKENVLNKYNSMFPKFAHNFIEKV